MFRLTPKIGFRRDVGTDQRHVSSSRLRRIPTVGLEQRDADEAEDATLCFFLKEKDTESQVSCKHRLNLRSKFNYNPFGLRFGKRGGRGRSAGERRRRGELLPALLLLTQLEQAS
ncbi:kisspeptin 2 isoform X2 [Hoplias malabaricus]|uniref:kisspeptin 2 isoform X1 n=1 Tax=Hoplias malabaricus TaxID=27720 RepID=UPI0034633C8E